MRTLGILLVTLMLLVACGGDDDSGGDVVTQSATSASGQATSGADDEPDADATTDDEEDDSGSSDEEGPHAPLTIGSSAEVDSHTPDPMAMSDSSVDVLAPLKVTIVSIIDPAISESEIFQPEAGNRFWAVEVLLEATGDKPVNSGEPWIVTDTDGNEYENMYLTGAAADVGEDITYSAIEPGQSKQGVVVFELPEAAVVKSVSVNASIFVGGTLTFDAS